MQRRNESSTDLSLWIMLSELLEMRPKMIPWASGLKFILPVLCRSRDCVRRLCSVCVVLCLPVNIYTRRHCELQVSERGTAPPPTGLPSKTSAHTRADLQILQTKQTEDHVTEQTDMKTHTQLDLGTHSTDRGGEAGTTSAESHI